jgi:N-methylhydantoinase A/oxoprolinase/acetone carboxylase beta subunit
VLTADIDIGGTLTDGLFTQDNRTVCVKVDTTPHDLTVCLFDCLSEGGAQLGFADLDSFLEDLELIRWSTTITSNVLAERHGPRVGLLVSRGHERNLYGSDPRSVVLSRILCEHDVVGIGEDTTDTQVMNEVRSLLESGVRRICVSLRGAHRHPERETQIKHIIAQQYPDHFLGSVPVLAGSDISKSADDATRTYCALINAYTHGALAATLFKAEDELREGHRFSGTFLVSHVNGGAAGIAKTKAIDTIESGPILGIHGSAYLAALYGASDVMALDVGGTTAKMSVLVNGQSVRRKPADFFGIPVHISLPYLRSIALGGGSIVTPSVDSAPHRIVLGPESMGSLPGPACYNLGGDKPTLTDAFVASGLINPDYFLGGAKPIDLELARTTIEEQVAQPLGLCLEDACAEIISTAFGSIAKLLAETRNELGTRSTHFSLFAYGGNGGLFACGVAEHADIEQVYFFSLGPVFSAFGSSVSDISHVYERALYFDSVSEEAIGLLLHAVEEMKAESWRDLLGEGIRPEGIAYSLELDISRPGRPAVTLDCPQSTLRDYRGLNTFCASALGGASEFVLEILRLQVLKRMPKPETRYRQFQGADSSHALKGRRRISWGTCKGEVPIYRWEALLTGNQVQGCALLEGLNSTYFVPEGWRLEMDRLGNAKATRES